MLELVYITYLNILNQRHVNNILYHIHNQSDGHQIPIAAAVEIGSRYNVT